MRPIFELPRLIEAKLHRRAHIYPELISISNVMGRADVHVVHHELRVLSRNRVHVGQRRQHRDALAVAAQVGFESRS